MTIFVVSLSSDSEYVYFFFLSKIAPYMVFDNEAGWVDASRRGHATEQSGIKEKCFAVTSLKHVILDRVCTYIV